MTIFKESENTDFDLLHNPRISCMIEICDDFRNKRIQVVIASHEDTKYTLSPPQLKIIMLTYVDLLYGTMLDTGVLPYGKLILCPQDTQVFLELNII